MRKSTLIFLLLLLTSSVLKAQDKFELSVTGKLGYYFGEAESEPYYSPDGAFSPGLGMAFNYNILDKTSLSLGIGGSFLSPDMIDHYSEPVDVKWHAINIPLEIRQGFGDAFFIAGGVTLSRQITGYWENQKIPEYNWQAGLGWQFEKLRLSMYYANGFNEVEKQIKESSTSWATNNVKHHEVYLKLEFPLWRF